MELSFGKEKIYIKGIYMQIFHFVYDKLKNHIISILS